MNSLIYILRWLLFLPTGILAGFVVFILYMMTFGRFAPNPGSIGYLLASMIGGWASGAVAAYVACYVSPSHPKWVAGLLVLLALVGAATGIPFLVSQNDWDYLLITIAQDIGILVISIQVLRGLIVFTPSTSVSPIAEEHVG